MSKKKLNTRKEELSNVWRYGFYESPIFYKTNLIIHITRVKWIAQEIWTYLIDNFWIEIDVDFLSHLAEVHDDAEIITWDYISPLKDTWTKEEKNNYDTACQNAIDILDWLYGKNFTKYNYKTLLEFEEDAPDDIHYYILQYADKLDGDMEAVHELLAGNISFENEIKEKFNRSAFEYNYHKCINLREKISQSIKKPIDILSQNPLLSLPEWFSSQYFLDASKWVHTKENIRQDSWYVPYEAWKELHFLYWDTREQEYLWKQREF